LLTRYLVLYLGCTLDFMPRSWPIHPMGREGLGPGRQEPRFMHQRRSTPWETKRPGSPNSLRPASLASCRRPASAWWWHSSPPRYWGDAGHDIESRSERSGIRSSTQLGHRVCVQPGQPFGVQPSTSPAPRRSKPWEESSAASPSS
jgi:hypothetical protein